MKNIQILTNNLKLYLKMEEVTIYYLYTVNGKEYFTPNKDLAFKRAEEGTEIKFKKYQNIT